MLERKYKFVKIIRKQYIIWEKTLINQMLDVLACSRVLRVCVLVCLVCSHMNILTCWVCLGCLRSFECLLCSNALQNYVLDVLSCLIRFAFQLLSYKNSFIEKFVCIVPLKKVFIDILMTYWHFLKSYILKPIENKDQVSPNLVLFF